ncbi:MAG: hypothetical protein PHQ21_07095 [Firmicutes bacterium]|nr:hypothetical protein [Bacillota bacterium]
MRRSQVSRTRLVALAGTMSAMAAALQLLAAFVPGPGHIASALATLPLALITWISPGAGFASYVTATLLVLIIVPEECLILLTTTGPLGVALGAAGAMKLSVSMQTLIGAATLSSGMTALMLVFKTDPLGPGVSNMGWVAAIGVYAGFALMYAWAWTLILRRITPHLLAIGRRNA